MIFKLASFVRISHRFNTVLLPDLLHSFAAPNVVLSCVTDIRVISPQIFCKLRISDLGVVAISRDLLELIFVLSHYV